MQVALCDPDGLVGSALVHAPHRLVGHAARQSPKQHLIDSLHALEWHRQSSMQRANRGAEGRVDCAPKSVSLVQRQLSQGCLAVGPAYYSVPSSLFRSGCYNGLKIFLFSLVCSLLLLLLSAQYRRVPGTGLVITVLHNQLVLNLVKVHLYVLAAHFRQPPVLEVEVLILSKLSASLSNECLIFIPLTYLGTLTLNLFKPSFEALVKKPGFFLKFYGCQVLLVTLLLIVKREKQSFQIKARKVCCLRIHRHCRVRVFWPHSDWLLRVNYFLVPWFWHISERSIQHFQRLLLFRDRLNFRRTCFFLRKYAGFLFRF